MRGYVESIKLGDMEVYNRPFDLWGGSQPIRITVRHGGSIHGNVDNAWSGTVVVLDADDTKHSQHGYSFSNSRFDVGPLRPGDYYVFAVKRPGALDLSEPVLKALLQGAEKLHLDKGSVAVMSLKVVPWP